MKRILTLSKWLVLDRTNTMKRILTLKACLRPEQHNEKDTITLKACLRSDQRNEKDTNPKGLS